MAEGDALIYAYLLDGKGGGEVIDWPAIDNWDSSQGLLWIHLDSKIPETRIWLPDSQWRRLGTEILSGLVWAQGARQYRVFCDRCQ